MNGEQLITEERREQREKHGFDAARDDQYVNGELSVAANCYMATAKAQIDILAEKGVEVKLPERYIHKRWPWPREWWKPSSDPVVNLRKAGALFLADSERLERLGDRALEAQALQNAVTCCRQIDAVQSMRAVMLKKN